MNESTYDINGLPIPWAQLFTETRAQLVQFAQFKPYPGWANLRVQGSAIYGLPCTEIEVRAPFEDRRVLQVQYHLAPLPPASEGDLHSAYVNILETHLGLAKKKEYLYNSNIYKGTIASSGVVFTCKWLGRDVQVSISVFGGNRQGESGTHAATLYVEWKNEVEAAKAELARANQFMEGLLPLMENSGLHKFQLAYPQQPFSDFNNPKTDPRKPEYDHLLRSARIALYKRDNFPVPDLLAKSLKENELALFYVPELFSTFVGNRYDMTFVKDDDPEAPQFANVLPARGSGGRELTIKGFIARDSGESNKLLDLAQWIERLSGVKVSMNEYYDD